MKVQLYAYRLIYISANRLSFSAVLGGNATHLLPTYQQARHNRLRHKGLSTDIANSVPIHNPRQGNYFVAVGPVIFSATPTPPSHGHRAVTHRPRQAVTACAVWRPTPTEEADPERRGQGAERNSIALSRGPPALTSFAPSYSFSPYSL